MNSTNALLGLFTETSLHAGAGQALGVIDLPIQREAHTAWPCVFGSAVKGALRARSKTAALQDIDLIFGPELDKAGERIEFAGALAVGDARLLLLPVRSLTTHFRWVTCPAALQRFKRDVERMGLKASFATPHPNPLPAGEGVKSEAWLEVPSVAPDAALVIEGNGQVFLEEYRFREDSSQAVALGKIASALARLMPDGLAEALKRQLAIVADDHFRHLAEQATPVNAHVRLDDKKTVARGALWYEETLPPETLLYVGLNAVNARKPGSELAADAVMTRLRETLFGAHPYLQLGGNETVGMGWCRVALLPSPSGRGAGGEGEGQEG